MGNNICVGDREKIQIAKLKLEKSRSRIAHQEQEKAQLEQEISRLSRESVTAKERAQLLESELRKYEGLVTEQDEVIRQIGEEKSIIIPESAEKVKILEGELHKVKQLLVTERENSVRLSATAGTHFLEAIQDLNLGSIQYDFSIEIASLTNIFEGFKYSYGEKDVDFENLAQSDLLTVGFIGFRSRGKSSIVRFLTSEQQDNKTVYLESTRSLSIRVWNSALFLDGPGWLSRDHVSVDEICMKDQELIPHFINNFIVENSRYLIVVIEVMTSFEQEMIQKVLAKDSEKLIYVLHNYKDISDKDIFDDAVKRNIIKSLDCQNVSEYVGHDHVEYYVSEKSPQVKHFVLCQSGTDLAASVNSSFYAHMRNIVNTTSNKIKAYNFVASFRKYVEDNIKSYVDYVQISSSKILDAAPQIIIDQENMKIKDGQTGIRAVLKHIPKDLFGSPNGLLLSGKNSCIEFVLYYNDDGNIKGRFYLPKNIEKPKFSLEYIQSLDKVCLLVEYEKGLAHEWNKLFENYQDKLVVSDYVNGKQRLTVNIPPNFKISNLDKDLEVQDIDQENYQIIIKKLFSSPGKVKNVKY